MQYIINQSKNYLMQIPEVVGEPLLECSPINGFADDSSFELPADAAQGWT